MKSKILWISFFSLSCLGLSLTSCGEYTKINKNIMKNATNIDGKIKPMNSDLLIESKSDFNSKNKDREKDNNRKNSIIPENIIKKAVRKEKIIQRTPNHIEQIVPPKNQEIIQQVPTLPPITYVFSNSKIWISSREINAVQTISLLPHQSVYSQKEEIVQIKPLESVGFIYNN